MMEAPWPWTILYFGSQIVTDWINAMFLLVIKLKVIAKEYYLTLYVVKSKKNKNNKKNI